jgi:hypothetical protein
MPTALVLAVLLAPALIALIIDPTPGRPRVRAMLLFGLSAGLGPLRALWSGGHSMAAAWSIVEDPQIVAIAWSAGAGGWLLSELTPVLVRLGLEAAARARARRLRAMRDGYAAEWGLTIQEEEADANMLEETPSGGTLSGP